MQFIAFQTVHGSRPNRGPRTIITGPRRLISVHGPQMVCEECLIYPSRAVEFDGSQTICMAV